MRLEWQGLTYRVLVGSRRRRSWRTVLQSSCGVVPPGRLLAVLGGLRGLVRPCLGRARDSSTGVHTLAPAPLCSATPLTGPSCPCCCALPAAQRGVHLLHPCPLPPPQSRPHRVRQDQPGECARRPAAGGRRAQREGPGQRAAQGQGVQSHRGICHAGECAALRCAVPCFPVLRCSQNASTALFAHTAAASRRLRMGPHPPCTPSAGGALSASGV